MGGGGGEFWKFADKNWRDDLKSAIELVFHFFSFFNFLVLYYLAIYLST